MGVPLVLSPETQLPLTLDLTSGGAQPLLPETDKQSCTNSSLDPPRSGQLCHNSAQLSHDRTAAAYSNSSWFSTAPSNSTPSAIYVGPARSGMHTVQWYEQRMRAEGCSGAQAALPASKPAAQPAWFDAAWAEWYAVSGQCGHRQGLLHGQGVGSGVAASVIMRGAPRPARVLGPPSSRVRQPARMTSHFGLA